jgi:lactose/L-arabinose transport system permease protein
MAARIVTREHITGWMFVGPALILLGIFMIFPIAWSLWMTAQTGRGLNFAFGGFANIQRLLGDTVFLRALGNTMVFLVVQVPIMITLALLFAVALNDTKLWGRSFFRTAIFLPCVTSLVAYAVLFKSMFSAEGVINTAITAIGFAPIPWLTDPFWAKILIVLAITWRWTGYNMIFYLAALQNVDRSIYEAARIDGVPPWARFVYLTLPMLKPVILFTTVISTIGTLQLFDEPYNITQGGPADATLTLSYYIYNLTFKFMPSFGYSSTVSWVIVVLVGILTFIQFMVTRERQAK